jgi:xanthine dehydrogenase molybdopterin-binding subunit B
MSTRLNNLIVLEIRQAAALSITSDGSVNLSVSGTEIGQGNDIFS